MSICPQCCHNLQGLQGTPSEPHGRFTSETRCPECAFVIPAGARVVVGASTPSGVGGRISWGLIIGFVALLFVFGPNLWGFLNGFVKDPSLGYLGHTASSLLPLAVIAWSAYNLFAGVFHVSGARDPADITARIRRKSRWLVQPGKIESFDVGIARDARRRSGANVDSDSQGVIRQEIEADSLRTIFALDVPARRGVRGRVLNIMLRRDGHGGVAASMFVVTTLSAVQYANDLLDTIRERQDSVGARDSESRSAASPADDPAEPITQVGSDKIELSGSPFEPKFAAEVGGYRSKPSATYLIAFPILAGGVALLVWGNQRMQPWGFMMSVVGLTTVLSGLYARYRSGPARWTATPGALRIVRYTRPIPFLWPKVRTIRAARFGGVQVWELQGVPVLEVRKAGASKPYAILVADDLRRRDPKELAAAIDAMVRRVN